MSFSVTETDAAEPETSTLISELLQPKSLRALGIRGLRPLARTIGCDDRTLRRLKNDVTVWNDTYHAVARYFGLADDKLFDPRPRDEVLHDLRKYLAARGTRK